MITISLCMIVRNEENSLARCLGSVEGITDEIVIVDTGSTDKTKELAASFGAVVFDFVWIDHFAAARNFSFSKATSDYILWLDADDFIEEKDRQKILRIKHTLTPDVVAVSMNYNLSFDSDGNVISSLRRNRLVKRECNFQWIGPVHEYLEVFGYPLMSDAAITHSKDKVHTDRNLRIYRARAEAGEAFSPRDLYYYANELRENGFFEEAADYYHRFLDTDKGWIEDNYQACLKLALCYEQLAQPKRQAEALLRTLQYDIPRSEFCCRYGAFLFGQEKYNDAAYWYELATALPERTANMGMQDKITMTWLPHLQLCLCYDRLGQYERASYHNEAAAYYAPSHPSMKYNRDYFKQRLGAAYTELEWRAPQDRGRNE
ncbi:glycosyltransferase [Paenibacillus sp. NFR01]|uniref:glycosyltransferase n=1 Tax=Paenibacillus sp. NFR01 TaxID=1566279 RepID=UPI0008D076AB|nr:glycosyltransferase [Paenibacillus sp. NFR01]SET20065.1 Glycosyltransferase involved in cell wall bisynthesis [Paenibacillus sp. NFR01]